LAAGLESDAGPRAEKRRSKKMGLQIVGKNTKAGMGKRKVTEGCCRSGRWGSGRNRGG